MLVRQGKLADCQAIAKLFEAELQRSPSLETIQSCLNSYPSAVAYQSQDSDELLGFAYCGEFAPDIIELYNILVDPTHQSKGVGSKMLQCVLAQAKDNPQTSGVILVNSELYPPMRNPFRFGTGFYSANGFSLVADTGSTKVFYQKVK